MEPIGTVSGLASGIDFRALVDAIIQAESQPALRLTDRKTELERRTTAWGDIELRVRSAFDRSSELADPDFFKKFTTNILGSDTPVSVTAGSDAVPGSFDVEVLQLADRQKLSSSVYQDRTQALGLAGEFVVGGRAVQIAATDSLDDIAQSINAASTSSSNGVSASVVGASSGGYRIVVTADRAGAAGFSIADGSDGLARALGFVDTTTSIKHQTSDGATSDGFQSSAVSVGALLGLSNAPAAASVTLGAINVTIDLANDSLEDIADAVNAAAAGAGSLISAQVVTEQDASGSTVRKLDIGGTTAFTDANGILETLGVLEAGRSAVQQQVGGNVFTDGDATTIATGSTRLRDLWVAGSDADVNTGDTLTITGTHGDGTTFTKTVAIGGSDRLNDLLAELNSASDGFGVGGRTATASIVDGRVVVTDDTGGTSRLDLEIISHNEGGGALDFGAFDVTTAGRDREISSGRDAELLVDGAFYTRSSNSVTDVVEGVTIDLESVSTGGAVTVQVDRDVDAVVAGIEAFVQAFNAVSEFVLSQFNGAGAEEGEADRPLSGDLVVRQIRNSMRNALESAISSNAGSFSRLSELGIEANRDGLYDIDSSALRAAVESDPQGVERIFAAYGAGSVGTVDFLAAGSDVPAGTYDVFVSTVATQASALGTGFAGSYVDDGTPDTMTVTESSTGSNYQVALTNGMTLQQIVDALNSEFADPTVRELQAANALSSDAVGSAATDATLLQDLFDGVGTNLGVANGDRFTISGTRDDGSSFFREWTVSDVSTQSLGALRSEISAAIGTDVAIDLSNGVLTARALADGPGSFTLGVTSDNAGGGTFSLGGMNVMEPGRGSARMTASDVGGQLQLSHDDYGSAEGFSIAYAAGGTDGSASLGVAAGAYAGVDVQGTIGGDPATGIGQTLTVDAGSDLEGLAIQYSDTVLGSVGNVTYSRGIASIMESLTDGYLDGSATSIQGIVERIDTQVRGIDGRIERLEQRLAYREEALIRRFTRLEEALAQAQSEMAWMEQQLGSLTRSTNSS